VRAASDKAKRVVAFCVAGVVRGLLLLAMFWSAGATYFCSSNWLPDLARPLVIAAACVGVVFVLWKFRRKVQWLVVAAVFVLLGCLLLTTRQASHQRQWADDHAVLPSVRIDEDIVTIRNFRRCEYRSEQDYDCNYEDLTFAMKNLKRVWFGVQRFTALEGLAHTFLSFEIDEPGGSKYFCVSVEIRREQGEAFSPVQGMFRQFELIYVIADERDAVGVRTVHRPNDRVYLYPVNADAAHVQLLFRDIARRVDGIEQRPEFYHSLLNNCTNNLAAHTSWLADEPIDSSELQIVLPGYSDRFAYSRGLIGSDDASLKALQNRCRVDQVARRAGLSDGFSEAIREGL
jgi:hypothetical protein